ncbi:MAG: hypothetical protein GX580_08370, partial [Candidatus Hydrogenedens sp.]|nr:hypothetical protein [Candidatus Hydrogenedens sp.]
MKELETCCGLFGEDLKAVFRDDRRQWDEPGGQCTIVAVVPETGVVHRWENKAQAWNEFEDAIGKRATGKCKCIQEAAWLFLDKVPFEMF